MTVLSERETPIDYQLVKLNQKATTGKTVVEKFFRQGFVSPVTNLLFNKSNLMTVFFFFFGETHEEFSGIGGLFM